MKKLMLLALLPLALTGCQDDSELDNVKSQLAHTRQDLNESREEARTEREALQARIAELERRMGQRSGAASQPTLREELDALKAELGKTQSAEEKEALERRIAAVESRVEKVKDEAVEEARKSGGGTTGTMVNEDKIAEMAAKKLAEEQPTKNFQQAIARLNLSEAEKQAIQDEIIKSKKEILELLEVPTADGRHFGEELIDTFIKAQMSGENKQAEIMTLFAELSQTKVPGDAQGRTYVQMIEDVKKRNRESIGRILKPEDQKKLDKAHGDWTDFEGIEGDPFGELYMQRLKKYQEENKK